MTITKKPILPTLFLLSWPIILGQGMQLMYNLADTFWVGNIGAQQLAAISVSFPLIFIILSIGAGFSIAGVTLVSQYTGAEKSKKANLAAGQILSFGVLLAIIFAGFGLFFGKDLLRMMGAKPEVLKPAWEYFQIILWGSPLMFMFFIFTSVMQGVGDSKTPMKIRIATVILNIVLDPFLIFGWWIFPELGIAGAAWATIFSRLIASSIGLFILFSETKKIKLSLSDLKPDKEILKKIIKIGSPSALGMSALSIAIAFMTSIVASFGTFALAVWGIVSRITSVIRLPSQGLSRATGVLVGQHLGADNPEKAEEAAWKAFGITFLFMSVLVIFLIFLAPQTARLFSQKNEVISIAVKALRITGFAYVFLGIQIVLSGALTGAGKTAKQMLFRVLTLWGLQIPISYYLSNQIGWGTDGIWWGILTANFLGCLIITIWFKKGTWKSAVIKTKKVLASV